jgi:hypothetical protein
LQAVKAESRNVHVLGMRGYIQQLQKAHAFPGIGSNYPARLAGEGSSSSPLCLKPPIIVSV